MTMYRRWKRFGAVSGTSPETLEAYRQLIAVIKKQNLTTVSEREMNSQWSVTKTYRMEEKASPQMYKIADHLQTERNYLDAIRGMKLEKSDEKRVSATH